MEAANGRNRFLATAGAAAVAVVVAVAVVLGVFYLRAPRITRVRAGQMAPDFTLPFLNPSVLTGPTDRLSAQRGGPTVLVFFDTRWPATNGYLSTLERTYRRYFRRGLRMVGVCLDADLPAARQFVLHHEVTFTLLSDPGGAAIRAGWDVPRAPETYLLDPQGKVEAVYTEPLQPRDPATREAIERHLEPSTTGW